MRPMATAEQLNIESSDIVIAVEAYQDSIWYEEAELYDSNAIVHASVYKVIRQTSEGTFAKLLATTDPVFRNIVGRKRYIPTNFENFIGGEDDRVVQELKKGGWIIRPSYSKRGNINAVEVFNRTQVD